MGVGERDGGQRDKQVVYEATVQKREDVDVLKKKPKRSFK